MYGNVQECGWRMNLRGFQIGAMLWKNMYTDDFALLSVYTGALLCQMCMEVKLVIVRFACSPLH